GLFVRVRLPIGEPREAILVPERAVGTGQGQKFIYVVDSANKVQYRRAQVGRLHNGWRAVTSGVVMGEKVVVSGLQRVRPGAEVNAKMAAEEPHKTAKK